MNPKVEEYLLRAWEFHKAAEVLAENELYSISVGRTDYSMYHAATAVLLRKGIERSSHHSLIAAFGQYMIKTDELPRHLYKYLQDAFDMRQDADYGPHSAISEQVARTHLERAKEFIEACQQLMKS